ncbi:MAG: hypothetical protein RSE50_14615, partial [Myroides sp.]
MKKSIVLLLLIIAGCAGEDACFSKKGDAVSQQHQLSGFHTVDIPMNVSAEIIPSTTFKMEIQSFENRIEALSFEGRFSRPQVQQLLRRHYMKQRHLFELYQSE